MMEDIYVGDDVLVNNKHKAVVKYVGPTAFADGTWYGLELEREIGKHEGTVLGVQYFTAPKKCGTFVKRDNLSLYDAETEASSRVQSAMRMSLAKKKVKAEVAWRTFNALDADDESRVLARRQRLMTSALGTRLTRGRLSTAQLDAIERDAEGVVVCDDYSGPHLSFPLSLDQICEMMTAFGEGRRLHYKYGIQLLARYRRYAAELPTLCQTSVPDNTTLTVVGDTHGQLQDLFSIFSVNGMPSPVNRYLINGDFVDRGEYSCEIVFTLLAFCLLYPSDSDNSMRAACLLNRGNHETHNQNLTGGFLSEVLDKYSAAGDDSDPEVGLNMYDMFQSAFDSMPLAHVITSPHQKVFVVHGGLMQRPGVALSHISAIKRKREIPYGFPGFEDKLYEDLMWSDPREIPGTTPSDRGAGVFFGPDVTHHFCEANGISLVVRSHECVPEGFMYMHDELLLTIFSASRYCGRGSNKGSIAIFKPDLTHAILQYMSPDLEHTQPCTENAPPLTDGNAYDTKILSRECLAARPWHLPTIDVNSKAGLKQEEAVKKMIIERVILHKPDLYLFWNRLDPMSSNHGLVSKHQWAEGMRIVLQLDLPWLSLASSLCDVDNDGNINYPRFLDRYRIAMRETDLKWMEGIVESACQKLFVVCHSLESAYKYFDTDSSGFIEFEELEKGLLKMDIGLSRPQIVELMNSMDVDGDGRIQFSEFSNRFKLVFSKIQDDNAEGTGAACLREATSQGSLVVSTEEAPRDPAHRGTGAAAMPHPVDPAAREVLQTIGAKLLEKSDGMMADVYAAWDTNGDGLLSFEEFKAAVASLDVSADDDTLQRIMDITDTNKSGKINFHEFCGAFSVADTAAFSVLHDKSVSSAPATVPEKEPRTWQQGVIEQVVSALYEYRVELAAAFRMFDTDGDGVISKEEFRVGLQALSGLDGGIITNMQCDEMLKALDTDGNGEISYSEFVNAFNLVDAHDPAHASASAPNVQPNVPGKT